MFTTTADAAKVKVVFTISKDDSTGRYIVMKAGTSSGAVSSSKPTEGAIYDDTVKATKKGSDYTVTLTCSEAGVYSLGGTNGILIKSVSVEM